jgi:hypothetical protein
MAVIDGLDMADGTKYTAKPGDYVNVSEGHARAIRKSWYGRSGVMNGQRLSFGTRRGRWCAACRRLWNAWNIECPKCGAATTEEGESA